MPNQTIPSNDTPLPYSTGALSQFLKRRCARMNGKLCNTNYKSSVMIIIGCASFLCALLLLCFLAWDRQRKKSKRFRYVHDNILFISRFLILFGTHHFVFYAVYLTAGTILSVALPSPIATIVLVFSLATYSIWSWQNERKLSNNNIHIVSNGNNTSSASTVNSSIVLQAEDVFQDFLNTTTACATATSVAQVLLIIIYILGIIASVTDRYPNALAHPTSSEIYPTVLVSSIIISAYSVGVGNVFGKFHSLVYFWLDAISFVQNVTYTQFVYVSSTEDMTGKRNKQLYDPDSMNILKASIFLRAAISIIVNCFCDIYITIALPTRLCLSHGPYDFVLNAIAMFYIIQMDDLNNDVTFRLSIDCPVDDDKNCDVNCDCEPADECNYFRSTIVLLDEENGIEFREYPQYSYVEYDTPQTMKIAMKDQKPLDGSHVITHSKMLLKVDNKISNNNDKDEDDDDSNGNGNSNFKKKQNISFHIVKMRQPIKSSSPTITSLLEQQQQPQQQQQSIFGRCIVKDTKSKQLVAVAKLSNPLFNYAYFHDRHATTEEILSYAEKGV